VRIESHVRRQSVWSLIARIATILAQRENAANPRRIGLVKEFPKESAALARQAMRSNRRYRTPVGRAKAPRPYKPRSLDQKDGNHAASAISCRRRASIPAAGRIADKR